MKTGVVILLLALFAVPAWAQPRPEPKPTAPAAKSAPRAARVDPRAVLRSLEEAFSAVADRATPAVVRS